MKTPWHIWVVGLVSLIWHAGGAFDYVMSHLRPQFYIDMIPEDIRPQMLEIPMAERLTYDAGKNLFFVNFEGLNLRSAEDIERIRQAVDDALKTVGHKVNAIVNYDRFTILPELVDDYIGMVKGIVERHYHEVTRYTSNTFLRVKIGEALQKGRLSPHLYETADQAEASLPATGEP